MLYMLQVKIKYRSNFLIPVNSQFFLSPWALTIHELGLGDKEIENQPRIKVHFNLNVSLVPRHSRLGQSWTLPWAVTSPRDTRLLSPRLRADNGSRENAYGLGCLNVILDCNIQIIISRKVVGKMCTRQSQKVIWNMIMQCTVPNDCSYQTYFCCFPLALVNITWNFGK